MSPTGDEIARAHVRAWELLVQSVPARGYNGKEVLSAS